MENVYMYVCKYKHLNGIRPSYMAGRRTTAIDSTEISFVEVEIADRVFNTSLPPIHPYTSPVSIINKMTLIINIISKYLI